MRVITKGRLSEFISLHPDAGSALRAWYAIVSRADWHSLVDVLHDFPSADLVWRHCTIFNIRGGNYRLVSHIDYRCHLVFLRFFLTHAEYDKEAWKHDC